MRRGFRGKYTCACSARRSTTTRRSRASTRHSPTRPWISTWHHIRQWSNASEMSATKSLHPMNDAALEHILRQFAGSARQMSPDHLIALVEAQTQIDDYLEWLRTSLVESVTGEAEALSLEQLFEHLCKGIEDLTRLAAKSADCQGRSENVPERRSKSVPLNLQLVSEMMVGSSLELIPLNGGRSTGPGCCLSQGWRETRPVCSL